MGKRPTEEELGIEQTPEEVEALARPAPEIIEDDVPIAQDEDTDPTSMHQVVPKPETAVAAPARVKDPLTGKFVAKDPAPVADARPDTRTVDLRALQEERALRRQTEERMNQLLDIFNRREARAAKSEEPAAPEKPTLDVDPLGYIKGIGERLDKFEGETAKQAEARQAQERDNQQYAEVLNVAVPQFNEAIKADPTLPQLQSAILESFAREIAYNNGIPLDAATPQQRAFIEQQLNNLERQHIAWAVSRGINVADHMRGLAQSRGVTVAAPAATPQPGQKPAAKTIPERQAAQARHMSLGDLPGSAAPSQITAKDIGKMTTKEFAAFAKRVGDAGLDDIMGKLSVN